MNRNVRILEDQNSTLKSKVDELKNRASMASSSEADLKNKLSTMNRSLKEHVNSSSTLQEELSRVKKTTENPIEFIHECFFEF